MRMGEGRGVSLLMGRGLLWLSVCWMWIVVVVFLRAGRADLSGFLIKWVGGLLSLCSYNGERSFLQENKQEWNIITKKAFPKDASADFSTTKDCSIERATKGGLVKVQRCCHSTTATVLDESSSR